MSKIFKIIFTIAFIAALWGSSKQSAIPLPIKNLGATCYMNSVLQALNQVEPLTQFMLSRCTGYYKPDTIGSAYVALMKTIHVAKPVVLAPEPFCIPVFEKYFASARGQQDAGEFLGQLLDSLSETDILDNIVKNTGRYDTTPPLLKSSVNEIFVSILRDIISPADVKPSKDRPEKIVLVSIEREIKLASKSEEENRKEYTETKKKDTTIEYKHLTTCLGKYFGQELLEQSSWVRRDGKPVSTTKKISLVTAAPYFIIQLKRNVIYGSYKESIALKLEHPVSFPLTDLDMSVYATTKLPARYDLLAVVQHTGSFTKTTSKDGLISFTSSGHYAAYVKSGNQWFFCNDDAITAKTTDEMEKIARDGSDGTFTPYILFYKRQAQPKFDFEPDPTCVSGYSAPTQPATPELSSLFELINRLNALAVS